MSGTEDLFGLIKMIVRNGSCVTSAFRANNRITGYGFMRDAAMPEGNRAGDLHGEQERAYKDHEAADGADGV